MKRATEMAPADDALQYYVDALLDQGSPEDMPEADAASPTSEQGSAGPRYRVCRIASIRLALPAESVLDPLPLPSLLAYSSPHGYLGRHRYAGSEWKVIDLASLVTPGVPHPLPDTLVPLAGQAWALACSVEPQCLEIDAAAVQWRHGGGARPWLAGMTREGGCAIVDPTALVAALQSDARYTDEA